MAETRNGNATAAAVLAKSPAVKTLATHLEGTLSAKSVSVANGASLVVNLPASLAASEEPVKVITATKPAGMRGFLMFHSRGRSLRYFFLGCIVWWAEFCKFCWAALRCLFSSQKGLRIKRTVYAHNLASIFTTKTPKEIFLKYYSRLP